MPYHRWTAKEDRRMRELARAGATRRQIALDLKLPYRVVQNHARTANIAVRPGQEKIPPERRARLSLRAAELCRQGLGSREAGARLGVSHATACALAAERGERFRGRPDPALISRRVREVFRVRGLSPPAFPLAARRADAERAGWPEAESAAQARVLEAIYRQGPMTNRELAAACGLAVSKTDGQPATIKKHLRRLRAFGYVVSDGRRKAGKARPEVLHRLSDSALARRRGREGGRV